MSKILHIVPGTDDVANGMVVVARLLAKEQGDAEVVDLNHGIHRIHEKDVEEVWVHGMWLPKEWFACRNAFKLGKKLVRMTHGSLSPIYLTQQSPLKKWLVSPIERHSLRKADKVVATCNAEVEWIRSYEPHVKGIEIIDLRRFFNLNLVNPVKPVRGNIRLLYFGRRHPLKGIAYLEEVVRSVKDVELRTVSNAFGEEKEKVWDWCDVLVLPTLSENFGLVVAEALERGKRVITTDGAPAWGDGNDYGGRLIYLKGYRDGTDEMRVRLLKDAIEKLKEH